MLSSSQRRPLRPSAVQLLRNLHRAPAGAFSERLALDLRDGALGQTAQAGLFLVSPQEVISQIDRTDSTVDVLWNELENRSSMPGASIALVELRTAFNEWRNRWKLWRNTNRDYWSLFWSAPGVRDELATWERALDAWRDKFRALGGDPLTPKPPPPAEVPPVLRTVDNLSYAAMAIAAAVGLFIVVRTVKGGV